MEYIITFEFEKLSTEVLTYTCDVFVSPFIPLKQMFFSYFLSVLFALENFSHSCLFKVNIN